MKIEKNGDLYGCDVQKAFESKIRFPVFFIQFFGYWIWDLLVLFLYWRKIRQFTKSAYLKIDQQVYSRISYVLNKILFLTLLYQTVFISNPGFFGLWSDLGVWGYICDTLNRGIVIILNAFIMFIMMEHNDEIYKLLVTRYFVGACKCNVWYCCCCSENLYDVKHGEIELNAVASSQHQAHPNDVEQHQLHTASR